MKTFMMISWRNMWRQKRRSLVVISSMAIGIFAMLFSMGIINGMNMQMVENNIRTAFGHIAIHKEGFQEKQKLEYNFFPDKKIYALLKNNRNIEAYTPRVKVQGMVRSSESSRGVYIVGIDPEKEKTVSKMYDYTEKKEGSSFLDDVSANEILISKSLANKLDLVIGDNLVIMTQDQTNEIVGEGFMIKGLYESPIEQFDKYFVFVGIKKLQNITGIGDNISEITIITDNRDTVNESKLPIIRGINNKELEVLSWMDMNRKLVSAIKLFDQMMYIFFMIIFITIIFMIANTLIMSIMERFHEIGVMKCIGTRPSRIFFMVIFEAVNLGIVGLTAGALLGFISITILSWTGLDFSAFVVSMRSWGTGSILYPLLRFQDIAAAAMIVLITTVIAALYPAVKAARIKPLEALHFI